MTICGLLLIIAGLFGLGLGLAPPANPGATALIAVAAIILAVAAVLGWPRHRRLPLLESSINGPRP